MSGYLITGDWQATSRNLSMIDRATERERELLHKYQLCTRIDLGDLKDPYNPVDARIGFAMQDRFQSDPLVDSLVVMGNHDRLSQNDNELSWFRLLHPDQTRFVTKPYVEHRDGVTFYVLPYNSDVGALRESALWLARQAADAGDLAGIEKVLLFHCDLREADYGHPGTNIHALSIADLHLASYHYAFGGHIHKPQELVSGKAWYVGSPFAMDWGEVNEQKRFLLYRPGKGVKSVPVGLPGLYDWDFVRQHKIELIPEDTVRLRIPAKDGRHFRTVERRRIKQFADKYPDQRLHCVAEYAQGEVTDYTFTQGDDRSKVTKYIEQRYAGDVELTEYVIKALELASSSKSLNTEGIQFVSATATNYTSFAKVRFDFRKRGLVCIRGINEDWPGRSNGSGKSNFMDLVRVGMFGTTGKGQEADNWASDTLDDEPAKIHLRFRTAQGQKVDVVRERRPTHVSVWVNNEDTSSGLSGREKAGTQGLISQLSGYDLRMLTNAVYIDQEQAHEFLVGTRKKKSDLLYKFQGLERFETARELVAADTKTHNKLLQTLESDLLVVNTRWQEQQHANVDLKVDYEAAIRERDASEQLFDGATARYDAAKALLKAVPKDVERREQELAQRVETLAVEVEKRCRPLDKALATARAKREIVQEQIETAQQGGAKCRTCGRPFDTPDAALLQVARLKQEMADLVRDLRGLEKRYCSEVNPCADELSALQREHKKVLAGCMDYRSVQRDVEAARKELDLIGRNYVQAQLRADQLVQRLNASHTGLTELEAEGKKLGKRKKRCQQRLSLYKRAVECLERTGIPAYLCGLLCPALSESAKVYAELFAEDALQVVFEFVDGEFDCRVLNSQGSNAIDALSTGERSTAALITAFALRSAAPKTNLLILDEPGRGLDELGQRRFAEALGRLREDFATILVTTHERALETALPADTVLTVTKRDRISRLS